MFKNKKSVVAVIIKNVATKTANIAFGSASICGMYQPKEPKIKK